MASQSHDQMKKRTAASQTLSKNMRRNDRDFITHKLASQGGRGTDSARRTIPATDCQTRHRSAKHFADDLNGLATSHPATSADSGIGTGVGAKIDAIRWFQHHGRHTFSWDKSAGFRYWLRAEARRREQACLLIP